MLPVPPSFTQWCFSPSHKRVLLWPSPSNHLGGSEFPSFCVPGPERHPAGLGWFLSPCVALRDLCSSASALPQMSQASALHQQRSAALGQAERGPHAPQQGCAQPSHRAWSSRNPLWRLAGTSVAVALRSSIGCITAAVSPNGEMQIRPFG